MNALDSVAELSVDVVAATTACGSAVRQRGRRALPQSLSLSETPSARLIGSCACHGRLPKPESAPTAHKCPGRTHRRSLQQALYRPAGICRASATYDSL